MNSSNRFSARAAQSRYFVVAQSGSPIDVSPKTTLRRAIRIAVTAAVAVWMLSLAGMAIA